MNSTAPEHRRHAPFTGTKYQRLCHGMEVLTADPAFQGAPHPFNAAGIHSLVDAIVTRGLLDHLDEHTANQVSAFLLIDFMDGVYQIAERILHLTANAARSEDHPSYDTLAVISGLGGILALMLDTEAWLTASADKPGNTG